MQHNAKCGRWPVKSKRRAKPAKTISVRRDDGTTLASMTWPATKIDFDMSSDQWMLRLFLVRVAVKAAGMDCAQFEKSFLRMRDDGDVPETIEHISNARALFEGVSAVLRSVEARFLAMACRHDPTTLEEMAAVRGLCLEITERGSRSRATA